jgi:osmotically-inducible protein OsmY
MRADRRTEAAALWIAVCAVVCIGTAAAAIGGDATEQLDPFAQATGADAACPEARPPLLTAQEAQAESHARVERGTRCAMEGTCEPGGAYRGDGELNERVRAIIASDRRFADTSIWLTTSRRWVTLEGCVRNAAQRRALIDLVRKSPGVERVFDELRVGPRPAPARGRP